MGVSGRLTLGRVADEQRELTLVEILTALVEPRRPGALQSLLGDVVACGIVAWTGAEGIERAGALGLSPRQARRLSLCAELASLIERESWAMPAPVTGPADVLAQVGDIRASSQERVVAIYLDSRNRPLHREVVAVGGLRASVVQPRDVLGPALGLPAAALVLVHNHPSGDTTPSREDLEVTRQLAAAARVLGLELLDHLVVSRTGCASLRELGHL
ncbi:MAG: hypothetical protein M3010_06925 [Candidatus Dormibacteraeota bacterium]|nr:hypothetical protein [Candidatus Dormibacteraeota bacterium]